MCEREREKDAICKKNLISDVAKDARVSSLPFQFVTYNRDPIRDCQCRGKLHPCKQTQLFKNIYVLPFSFPLSFVSFPESRSRPRGITYLVAIAAAAYDAHAHPILPSFHGRLQMINLVDHVAISAGMTTQNLGVLSQDSFHFVKEYTFKARCS